MTRRLSLLLLTGLFALLWQFSFPAPSTGQDLPIPQTVPNAERGYVIFETRCANCHGISGGGDGELAPQSVNPPTAFSNPDHRLTAVPSELFNTIKNGRLTRGMPLFGEGSGNPLTDEQIWDLVALITSFSTPTDSIVRGQQIAAGEPPPANLAFWATQSNAMALQALEETGAFPTDLDESDQLALIDYLRTGSYSYFDVALLYAPIEEANISGTVSNGTTETAVADLEVTLRGFTPEFAEAINLQGTTDADGRYSFDLRQVPPNLIYIVSTEYNAVSFASMTDQINRLMPNADFPITVFDTSTDSEIIYVEQLQIILDFIEDDVQIAELYTFSNLDNAVFIGTGGDPTLGTVQFNLPAGATQIQFQRGFSIDNFVPANDVLQTGTGWADIEPIRPGRGTASMLVTYRLPFSPGMSIGHPLPHFVNQASLLIPDTGVVINGNGWELLNSDILEIGPVSNYFNSNIQSASTLNIALNGRPRVVRDALGNSIANRSQQRELILGSIGLLIAGLVIYYLLFANQSRKTSADQMLQAILELDNAYEIGQVQQEKYQQLRQAYKAELMNIWSKGD